MVEDYSEDEIGRVRRLSGNLNQITLADGSKIEKRVLELNDKDKKEAARLAELNVEDMSLEERAVYELSTPIPLTDFMVRRPFCFLFSGFAILLLISSFAAAMGYLLPVDPHERDYFVWGDPYVNNYDKTYLASRELLANVGTKKAPL